MDDEGMNKGDGAKNALPRPALLVAVVIGSLYLTEVVIMNFFHEFAESAHFTMDALVLTAVLLPLLYFLIYRPFSKSVKDLKALSGTLERKVRERTVELEFSEALHRAVIASSADAVVRISSDGAVLSANPAAHRMLGYGKTELENKHISLLLPDGYERVLVEGFAASLDGWDGHSAASVAEAVAVTKSGLKLTVECTSSECLVNSEISFVIVMRDVTARKKAEEALRESEARFRQLSEASFEGIIVSIEGKAVDCNRAFARMFGYAPEEIIGKMPVDLSPPESQAVIMDHIRRGSEEVFDVVGRKKDGTLFPIEVQGRGVLYHGQKARVIAIRDISERVKAEQALQESEQRYRKLSDASFEGVVITVDGKMVDCNTSFALKFGYAPDEVIGKTPLDLVSPESYAIVADHIGRGIEGRYEAVGRKKDGTLFPIEIQGRGTLYHGQKARVTSIRDITERVKAEQAIRESEELLRVTFDNAATGMAFVSLDGKFLRVNATRCRIHGYEEHELIGRSFQEITHPDDLHSGEAFLRKVARGEAATQEVEKRFIRKDGGVIWCSVFTSLIKDAHGKPLHIFTQVVDITARKAAEDNLRASERKFRAVAQSAADAIISINSAGEIIHWNKGAEKMFGHAEAEALGKPVGLVIPKRYDEAHRRGLARAAAGGPYRLIGKTATLEGLRKDGSEFPLELSLAAWEEGGKAYFSGIIRDITERKAAEDRLKAAKEAAEEATTLKDKFVSLVSHDLKTPLASMIGFLKLVRYDYAEPLNEGAKLILDRAAESGEGMVRLIDDLLTISRFKTGQLKLNRQFFDAEYLGVMMAANYSHLARQKGIEIENTIPAYSRIYGDKTLLTEAVQNLVTNAIKFCKSGDHIIISLAEGDAPAICVRDTGPGIQPNLLDDLFKFEKKTSTRGTAGEAGTGFGLPLVKNIMELHGGDLGLASEPGKGCLFCLNLPYVRPKILLVDDDRSSRFLQTLRLRELNADIIEAENGEAALNVMATVRPHLIITDIQMPVMDGLELLKRIKGAPDTKDIPVIVVSGEFGMEIRDTVFKFGGDDFVTKKIDKVDFFPRVRRFIG